jgi:NitT/TauT family transport system ATP-binding protein
MLSIQELSFAYGKKKVLEKLSLQVDREEIVAILGASGSGKTTLFQLIAGLLPAGEGSINIRGQNLAEAKNLVSYMMQEDLLLPWRSVIGNVLLLTELSYEFRWWENKAKKERKEKRSQALKLLHEVGLQGCENYFPHELSGGMRQRTALARALALTRPLLLLDEPFNAIDNVTREELYLLLEQTHRKYGLTIVFITHNFQEAFRLANRVFILNQGRLFEENRKDLTSNSFSLYGYVEKNNLS